MVDANSLIEGHCKFRDGKKWKARWAVVTKLSPVADCLQLQIYRDEKERARNGQTKASLSLQAFLALESGFTLDKESHTLAIICQDLCVVLAFDNRERLIQWTVRIGNNLGDGQQFLVQLAGVPPKSKLTSGPVKMHVTDRKFCLTGGIPPRLLGFWEVSHLRRYGIVDGRLVFEGGSRCGKGEGVHVLIPDPPQLGLIIDSLEMSSKGQLLVRGPSRRLGSAVTDSPRKSLSRLSEFQSSPVSNEPIACLTPVATPATNLAISSTMSPTPRESRSAEALCNACTDNVVTQPCSKGADGSMWMSSEASSRCDLDSCDNLSVISPNDSATNLQEQTHLDGKLKHPASPTRNSAESQPLQIATKPMPSAMERCLSCMSKLGQHGQDILSPSWTMDLSVSSSTGTAAPTQPQSSNSTCYGYQQHGSIGSGNSDRLSISSHGSSGGVTEYYYDTPRSVLVAEARRNAATRGGTPPGYFQKSQMLRGGDSNGSGGGGSSPNRNPKYTTYTNGFNVQQESSSSAGCHCQNHPPLRGMSGTPSSSHENSHIYYNGVAEQTAHEGGKSQTNLHSSVASTTGHVGPYENYDFPKCIHFIRHSSSATATANHSSYACCNTCSTAAHSACNVIDWNKKPPMDRSSIASTSLGSEHTTSSEFYDTPPRHAPCACCNATTVHSSCPCCVPEVPGHAHPHHHTRFHYQSPLMVHINDPMDNYDVPPTHAGGIPPSNDLQAASGISRSVNGDGKMPLVSGGSTIPSAHAIYAQVDKTKKTPRQLSHHPNCHNCDNTHQHCQPIYENHGHQQLCQQHKQLQTQPTYANTEVPCKTQPPMTENVSTLEPTKIQVNNTQPKGVCQKLLKGPHGSDPASNYANLDYAGSLLVYENVQDIQQEQECDLVTNAAATASLRSAESTDESKKEFQSIPAEKSKAVIIENNYENTQCKHNDVKEIKESTNSHSPAVQEKLVTVSKDENSGGSAATSGCIDKEEKEEERSLPLRRSSSVPCKGGHANRGSASSSDSGVSGDGGLFFDDSSPLNDIGSLCLHESLPRKGHRSSPNASGKNAFISTPKSNGIGQTEDGETHSENVTSVAAIADSENTDPLPIRHYETIDESKGNCASSNPSNRTVIQQSNLTSQQNQGVCHPNPKPNPLTPVVNSTKVSNHQQLHQRPKNPFTLVSDANSQSSGASDMSDYIETLSSCSRGSTETVTSIPVNSSGSGSFANISPSSVSPRKSTNMKPRSGKEYFKIDRSMFKNN